MALQLDEVCELKMDGEAHPKADKLQAGVEPASRCLVGLDTAGHSLR